jgi:outer membrane protein assembly factor BamB
MMVQLFSLFLFLSSILFSSSRSDRHWPSWRGIDGTGSTTRGTYPTHLSGRENLLWKVELPGKGCSTPVVWDDRVFLTSPNDGKDTVLAFGWNGEKRWQTQVGTERKANTLMDREAIHL